MQELEQPRPTEAPRPENNFQRFIGDNFELFENLNSANTEFRKEDQGRRSDPYIDELAQGYLDIAASTNRLGLAGSYGLFRKGMEQAIFDGVSMSEGQEHTAYEKFYRYLSPDKRDALEDIRLKMGEVEDEYKEAMGSLRESRNSAWQATHNAFVDYLSASSDNLAHFGSFLTDPRLQRERESIGPFLHRLAQNVQKGKPENYFDQAVNLWKEEAMKEANEEILRRYLEAELKRSEESSSNGSAFFAGLRSGIEMGRGTTLGTEGSSVEDVIMGYLKVNPWPEVIKAGYKRILDTKYSSEISSARVALDQYRRVGEKFIANGEVFSHKDHKRRDKIRARKNEAVTEKKEEVETVKEYKIGIVLKQSTGKSGDSRFVSHELSSEELEDYLRKKSDKLAPNDQRMMDDVRSMIESVRDNPYGFGTKKTTNEVIRIEQKRFSLRELVPTKRGSTLSLSHDSSEAVRVSFIVDSENGLVMIEDIDTHRAFDRKLRSRI